MGRKISLQKAFFITLGLTGLFFSSVVCSISPNLDQTATQVGSEVQANVESLELTLAAMATAAPTIIIEGQGTLTSLVYGDIQGSLSYPSESIPAMRIVAFKVVNGQRTGEYFYTETAENASSYTLSVPAGTYWVVAYPVGNLGQSSDLGGGYTQMVPCGLSTDCSDHTFIDVTVNPNQTVTGIDPADWYAPDGAFPEDPIQ